MVAAAGTTTSPGTTITPASEILEEEKHGDEPTEMLWIAKKEFYNEHKDGSDKGDEHGYG